MSKEVKTPYKTLAIDSLGEWARLTFSKEMKKNPWDVEDLKTVGDYNGATERICVILRRLKNIRTTYNINIVVTAHEGIDRIYAKGGMIAAKGQQPAEPIAIFGRPDIPGQVAPNEVMRAFDNILRVRMIGTGLKWIANKEPLGGGGNTWEVKDRFNAPALQNGILPPSYAEIEKLAIATDEGRAAWNPPYMWLIYGPPGFKKTRSLTTFPGPIRLFDIDQGSSVVKKEIDSGLITTSSYDPEDQHEYDHFITDLFESVAPADEVTKIKRALGLIK